MIWDIEIVKAVAGTTGILSPLGFGVAFVWRKVEKRFERIEADLAECRRREGASEKRRAVQITVIELLWQKVQESDPRSPVLERAKHLLEGLKLQLPPDNPDLAELAREIDQRGAR